MPSTNDAFTGWRKSSRSNGQNGACVEVGFADGGALTGVRDTKDRTYGTLAIPANAWSAFLDRIKSGELD